MRVIDGSQGEGGGQILRTALAIAAVLGEPLEIESIRKGRQEPGLKAQHIIAAEAVRQLCGGTLDGATLGSETLTFRPGEIKGGNISLDIGTAGSIPLVMQAILPAAMFAKKTVRVRITGGTDVQWSMSADYLANVLLPQVARYARKISCAVRRRGYYPQGGGEMELRIIPSLSRTEFDDFSMFQRALREEFPPISLTSQGQIMVVRGVSHAANGLMEHEVAERQAKMAAKILSPLGCPVRIAKEYSPAACLGSGITLWAQCSSTGDDLDQNNPVIIGADALGAQGKPSERIGGDAARSLLDALRTGCAVDAHCADMLIPFMGLSGEGGLKAQHISSHAKTNIAVTQSLLGVRFECQEDQGIVRIIEATRA